MNKRQRKKNKKKIDERLKYLQCFSYRAGRQCGKTSLYISLFKISMSKSYKEFKTLKKYFKKIGLTK